MFTSSSQLKKLRLFLNLTQDEFAEKINTKRNSISMIESGRNKPTFEMVGEISKVFNISADYFLSEINPDNLNRVGVNYIVKKDNINDDLNNDNDDDLNRIIDEKNSFANETEYMNKVHAYIKKINRLYQRLIDVRVLLFQELKFKGDFSTKVESDLVNNLTRPAMETTEDGVYLHYPYENLDLKAKKQYLQNLENCIELFTDTFFEAFSQLYKGIRIPADSESRKEFLNKREALTNNWKYTHYIKSYS